MLRVWRTDVLTNTRRLLPTVGQMMTCFGAVFLFFLSLFFLRLVSLAQVTENPWGEVLSLSTTGRSSATLIELGGFSDLTVTLLGVFLALLTSRANKRILPSTVLILIYLLSFSQTLYFAYFREWLSFDIIRFHLSDLNYLSGSFKPLITSRHLPLLGASSGFLGGSIFLLTRFIDRTGRKSAHAALMLFFVVAALLVNQFPTWVHLRKLDWHELARQMQPLSDHWLIKSSHPAFAASHSEAFTSRAPELSRCEESVRHPEKSAFTHPPSNLILVFVESFRAHEWHTSTHSELIFQKLKRFFRGLPAARLRTVAEFYSTALDPGQTVRGQFSTLCSVPPNPGGIAPHLISPHLPIQCLTDLTHEAGYHNLTLTGFHKEFHNKFLFEKFHHFDTWFDLNDFRSRGVTEEFGDFGIADKPFLEEALRILRAEITTSKRPLFAQVTTGSSHFPPKLAPTGVVEHVNTSTTEYRDYLSQLHYVDSSLSRFLETLTTDKSFDNTLIVVLGDHSSPVIPHLTGEAETHGLALWSTTQTDLLMRIPIFFILPKLSKVEASKIEGIGAFRNLGQQIDILPTLAELLHFSSNPKWQGRSLLAKCPSPIVYESSTRYFFRDLNRKTVERSQN